MSIKSDLVDIKRKFLVRKKPKIFGIGANKTGTTSLNKAMKDLGFLVGNQRRGELLLEEWAKRDFSNIIKLCHTAEFFQDVPFSLPFTFIALDLKFPKSKFILTVRDSPEQWYNSITKFHGRKWGENGNTPTMKDLQKATYIFEGRPWLSNRLLFDTPENDPYNRDKLLKFYIQYNESVIRYFENRPNDLLILNLAEKGAYRKLCAFLGVATSHEEFPWENKTIKK